MLDRAFLIEALKNWGAWDFNWEKGWDKVTPQSLVPASSLKS